MQLAIQLVQGTKKVMVGAPLEMSLFLAGFPGNASCLQSGGHGFQAARLSDEKQ